MFVPSSLWIIFFSKHYFKEVLFFEIFLGRAPTSICHSEVCLSISPLFFEISKGVKGQKVAQNDRRFCLSHSIPQEPYIIWLWFLAKWWYLQQIFSFFQNFEFFGVFRAKNDLKLPISVCHTLHLRNCRSYHQDFFISRCFSLFKKKLQHFKN